MWDVQLNGKTVNNKTLANAIRFLSLDAVNNANSGHPGAPMGMADIATILWREFLKHNPNNPNWFNSCLLYTSPSPRDRQKSRMPSSA